MENQAEFFWPDDENNTLHGFKFEKVENPITELFWFSRETENVPYPPPQQNYYFEHAKVQTVYVLFEENKWYRIAYRKQMEFNCPDDGVHMAEFVFLEHPELLGVAIGFRRKAFIKT